MSKPTKDHSCSHGSLRWVDFVHTLPARASALIGRLLPGSVTRSARQVAEHRDQTGKSQTARTLLGEIRSLRKRGELEEAEDAARRARMRFPNEVGVAIQCAELATARGDLAEAEARWRELTVQFGAAAPPSVWLSRSRLLVDCDARAAAEVLLEGLSVHGEGSGHRYQLDRLAHELARLSKLVRKRGELSDAEELISRGRSALADSLHLAIEFAEIAMAREDRDEAMRRWQAVLDGFGADAPPRACAAMALLLRKSEKFDAAYRVLLEGLSLHPNAATLAKELAWVARDARWHPPEMDGWAAEPASNGAPVRITPPRTQAPHYARKHHSFIISSKLRDDPRFVRACAFGGMHFCHSKAKELVQWAADCRNDWLEGEGACEASWPRLSREERAGFVACLLEEVISQEIERFGGSDNLTLGLSSGYDSRALLHCVQRHVNSLAVFTYGQVGNADFDFASLFGSSCSLGVLRFDTSEIRWDRTRLEEHVGQTQNYPISPNGYVAILMNDLMPGRIEIHGNLGDSLTGGPPLASLRDSWQDSLPVFCRKANYFALQALFPSSQIASLLPAKPLIDGLPYAKQLDIGYLDGQRMRPLDGTRVSYLMPFRNKRWVGFWLSRSPEELEDRTLWIDVLKSFNAAVFPELSLAPCSNEAESKKAMGSLLYGGSGSAGVIDLASSAKVLPRGRSLHFCTYACYQNNPSFRRMIDECVGRLRKREVFSNAFVDDTLRYFHAGAYNADRMVNGLATLDLMAEAEFFS